MSEAQQVTALWHPDQFADTIKIDVTLIPNHVRDNMLSQLEQIVLDFFKQPGVREEYQEWLRNRKKVALAATKEGART